MIRRAPVWLLTVVVALAIVAIYGAFGLAADGKQSVMPANHRIQPESRLNTVANMKAGDRGWVYARCISYALDDNTSWIVADGEVYKTPKEAPAWKPGTFELNPGPLIPIVADKEGIYAVCFDHAWTFTPPLNGETIRWMKGTDPGNWMSLRFRDSRAGEKPETITWEPPKK